MSLRDDVRRVLGSGVLVKTMDELMETIERALAAERDNALELAAVVADQHWPESGHIHREGAVSCQMSVSIEIRRMKGDKERSALDALLAQARAEGARWAVQAAWNRGFNEGMTDGAPFPSETEIEELSAAAIRAQKEER